MKNHPRKGEIVASNTNTKFKVDWVNAFFLILLHIIGPILVFTYLYNQGIDYRLVLLGVFFYFLTGLSITAGYHRLFSHKSYQAHPALEYFYLIFGAAAFENTALNWCFDHRIHHRFVDQKDDPYNAKKGFWYSHICLLYTSPSPRDQRGSRMPSSA